MASIFKNIKKAFTKPPLGDQDWLEPSDQVLSNIELAIREDDKKDRSFLVLFSLGFLFVGGIFVLLFFNPIEQEITKDKGPQLKKVEQNRVEKNKSAQVLAEATNVVQTDLEDAKTSQIEEVNQKANDMSIVSKKTENNRSQAKNEKQFIKIVNKHSNPSIKTQNIKSAADRLIEGKVNSLVQNKDKVVVSNQQQVKQAVPNMITPNSVDKRNELVDLLAVNYLPTISLGVFKEEDILLPILPNDYFANLDVKTFTPGFFIEAGVGVTSWNFILNDEYEALVESAAFEDTNGVGYATSLTVGRDLNPRLSLSIQGRYESINFNSGHNSTIVYDNSLREQTENLTMATPLGLVNNQVALFRTVDGNQDQTNLLVDLENEHQLTAVEFSMNANITLAQTNKFSFVISPGIGVQQILSAENELVSLMTNDVDITNGGSVAEGSFDSIKNTSPFTSLHLAAQRKLSDHWQLGLHIGGSLQLNPIQETMDLKTNVIRYNTQLVLRRSF